MRKFAKISSSLIFKEKLFSMALQVSTEQRIFKTLEYTIVNTNSKYKEDDFTGSIAVKCFKMSEYTQSISTMKHTHVNLTLYTPQPSVRLGELGW